MDSAKLAAFFFAELNSQGLTSLPHLLILQVRIVFGVYISELAVE